MGAGRTSARWGVRVGGLDFVRRNGRGEVNFALSLPEELTIEAGPGGIDRLAVMGPSGAGKSTFLNLLSCTSYPQSPGSMVEWTFPNGDRFAWGPDGRRHATCCACGGIISATRSSRPRSSRT